MPNLKVHQLRSAGSRVVDEISGVGIAVGPIAAQGWRVELVCSTKLPGSRGKNRAFCGVVVEMAGQTPTWKLRQPKPTGAIDV
jgi:hypothetical protein